MLSAPRKKLIISKLNMPTMPQLSAPIIATAKTKCLKNIIKFFLVIIKYFTKIAILH